MNPLPPRARALSGVAGACLSLIFLLLLPPAGAVDTDGDFLSDADETTLGTNINLPDTDGDGTPDGLEVAHGLLPLDPSSKLARPNVIFILCDDLGYGDLGVLFQATKSGKKHFTPNLDQMAGDGMILNQHYCPAPVCAPSRSSLLLGVHQGHANVRDNQFDKAVEENHNLATTLNAAGYSTALIGKYGLQGGGGSPAAWPAYPTKRGFDYFFGYVRHGDGHTHYPAHVTDSRGKKELYDGDTMIRDDLDYCYTADLFTARAKKLIIDETTDHPNKPFFLYLAYDTPHAALQLPTQAYPAPVLDGNPLTGGLQWLGTPGNMINTASGTIDSYTHPDYSGNGWTGVEERFATCVRRIDDCVGDLRQTLADLGISNDTIIVFSSDNGPHKEDYLPTGSPYDANYAPTSFDSYGPFEGIKRDTWEGGVRMPTLAVWPGSVASGQTDNTPSQFHDWLPTFTELAGWPRPSRTDGVTLAPLLTGSGAQESPLVYIEYYNNSSTPSYGDFSNHGGSTRKQMQVIHLEGYKGVRYDIGSHADNFRIHDINTDLDESSNLAGTTPFFDGLQQRMKDTVLRIRQPDSSAARPYDNELVPPVVSASTEPGLEYAAYEGLWPWLPEFTTLTSTTSGDATSFSLSHLTRTTDAGLLFTGYLLIPADGTWTFYTNSDAGTHLRIHDSQVIDDDYNHSGAEASGTMQLKAGLHPFRLYYRTADATPALDLQWSGPGTAKQSIPGTALFRFATPPPEPQPLDDSAVTTRGNPVTIDVLANDSDDGAPNPSLSISGVTTPSGGSAAIAANEIQYTPDPAFLGTNTFTYSVTDGQYFSSASVTVDVVYQGGDIWVPLNETTGTSLSEAGGYFAGAMSGFADPDAAHTGGVHGMALALDGTNDQVALTGLPPLPAGDTPRTVMAWIRVQAGIAHENQAILGYGTNTGANGTRFTFRLNGSLSGPNDQELRLEVDSGSIVGTTALDDGQWHHVAAVCDDVNLDETMNVDETVLYVDGEPETVSSSASRAMDTAPGTTAILGGSNHSANFNFAGDIDELRFYPTALTQGQVQAAMNATRQPAAAWHRRYFGDDPADWSADLDGDGLNRLGERAFGGQPLIADSRVLAPGIQIGASQIVSLSFNRLKPGTHDLVYTVFFSSDLAGWAPLFALPVLDTTPVNDATEIITLDASPLSTSPTFYEVIVTFTP